MLHPNDEPSPLLESMMTSTNNNTLSYNDIDIDIDALFSTFRQTFPIPKSSYGNGNAKSSSFIRGHDRWLLETLDLLRLLHTMNQQCFVNASKDSTRMRRQIALAYSMLTEVERSCPFSMSFTPDIRQSRQEVVEATDGEKKEENDDYYLDPIFHQNVYTLLHAIRNYTDKTCAKFQRCLDHHPPRSSAEERDLIYDIFLAPVEDDDEGENDECEAPNHAIDGEDDANAGDAAAESSVPNIIQSQQRQSLQSHPPTGTTPRTTPQSSSVVDPIQFQKQQQELLEEELASMASRLKSSTLAMNATLQNQTKELDSMEALAQSNLDQVTHTTKDVEGRLAKKRGWKKQLATWSLIGTVVGMWVLCFMVIRTVPKRNIGNVQLFGRRGGEKDGGRWSLTNSGWKDYLSKGASIFSPELNDEDILQDGEEQMQEQSGTLYMPQECEIHSDGTQTCFGQPDDSPWAMEYINEAEHRRKEQDEESARLDQERVLDERRRTAEEAERLERLQQERVLAEQNRKEQVEEAARLEEIETDRVAAERKRLEEQETERLEHEKVLAERRRLEEQEAARIEQQRIVAERKRMEEEEAARLEQLEQERVLAEQKRKEQGEEAARLEELEKDRVAAERRRLEEEKAARLELERDLAERRRLEEEEAARIEQQRIVAERKRMEEEEAARLDQLEQEKVMAERRRNEEEDAEIEQGRVLAERRRMQEEEAARLEQQRVEAERKRKQQEEEEAAKLEQERVAAERRRLEAVEAARLEQERVLAERRRIQEEEEASKLEQGRVAAELRRKEDEAIEAARLEQERVAAERRRIQEEAVEAARLEQERVLAERRRIQEEEEASKLEQGRVAAELRRKEDEAIEAARLEQERVAAERRRIQEEAVEAARLEQERVLAERRRIQEEEEASKLEQGRVAAELRRKEDEAIEAARLEQERVAAERRRIQEEAVEAARLEQERVLAERRRIQEEEEASKLEQGRVAAELRRKEDEAIEAARLEQERVAAERRRIQEEAVEAARLEQERVAAERMRVEAEEQQRIFAERKRIEVEEAARLEQERAVAERMRAEAEAEEQQRAEQKRMEEEAAARIEFERKETERVRLIEKDAKVKDTTVDAEQQDVDANAATRVEATDDALVFTAADVRIAAARSENELLAQYISSSPEMIDASDRGGWRPIHEAVRAGNLIGIQLLINAGCELTSRTGRTANGGTALWWAIQRFGEDHSIVQLLRSHGALEAGPTT
ncbi:hypothetical protein ACHAWU_001020 [Discostella pseudostelligera]|uniref:Uncharacterized protein n=1 Tax=Discostella pseudostelligera TaxID=259834 RepID=A0ABD3MG29_9STRA